MMIDSIRQRRFFFLLLLLLLLLLFSPFKGKTWSVLVPFLSLSLSLSAFARECVLRYRNAFLCQ